MKKYLITGAAISGLAAAGFTFISYDTQDESLTSTPVNIRQDSDLFTDKDFNHSKEKLARQALCCLKKKLLLQVILIMLLSF